MTIRGTEILHNLLELSDHSMVVSTFITAEKTDSGDEPINYHKSDLPLYKIEEIDEEGWIEVNKILSNQSWVGIAEIKAEMIQELIMERYVKP